MRQWVVDTWVLEKCNDNSDTNCLVCVAFLSMLLIKDKLCLDFEKDIEKEYWGHIRPRTWLSKWWEKMVREKGHLYYWSSYLPDKHRENLVNKLKFHDDDIKFIGITARSKDKLLVSGDSDYNTKVCNYLYNELHIIVMGPSTALTF